MHFKSIRTKLIFFIVLLTFAALLVLQATNIILLQNTFSRLVPSMMESSLQSAHTQISAKLKANFAALEAVAAMPYIRDTPQPLDERAQSLAGFVEENAANGYQACAVTDATGRAVLSSGFEIDVSGDDYFQEAMTGKEVVSDPFVSRATGNLLIVYAVPYYNDAGTVAGVITLDVDALHLSRDFAVQGLGETGVVFAIASDGTTVMSTDLDTVSNQLNDFNEVKTDPTLEGLVESERKMVSGQSGNSEHVYLGTRELMYYMPVGGTSWGVAVTQSRAEAYATVNSITYSGIVVMVLVVILSVVVGTLLARSISRPIRRLAQAAGSLALGDIGVDVVVDTRDETGELAESFRVMTESIRQQADVIHSIAQGDYTVALPVRSEADVMNKAVNHMVDKNNQLMGEIRTAAEQVALGAAQIAGGSQVLATGSTQQAATMQEFSASINEVYGQANANTELAKATVDEVGQAGRLMEESLASMEEMTAAMNAIEASSRQIANVIKVIDDIAFQTNILALNAAVEAAALIDNSVANVARGVDIAARTSEGLGQVGAIAPENAVAMGKVSQASAQQGAAIQKINLGIDQVSQVVQTNSATAEESAASAQELSAQSTLLNRIVDQFKLRQDAGRQNNLLGM